MDRRAFLSALVSGVLAAPLAAQAQQARKMWRVGVAVYGSWLAEGGPGQVTADERSTGVLVLSLVPGIRALA